MKPAGTHQKLKFRAILRSAPARFSPVANRGLMLLPELFSIDILGILHHAVQVTRPQHPHIPIIYTHHEVVVIPERPDFTLANSHDELDEADQSFTECGPFIEIWVTDDGEYGIRAFIRTANESPTAEGKHVLWSAVQDVIASARP